MSAKNQLATGGMAGWVLASWYQYLLERAEWDANAARDVLRDWVVEHLSSPDGVLVVDETGFIKKGRHSAGGTTSVQRGG